MKKTYLIYLIIAFKLFTGCTDKDFLEKYPLTSISQETYFKTENDFKLYVNQFYDDLGDWAGWSYGPFDDDRGSDNQISSAPDPHLNGETIVEVNDNQWTNKYRKIRDLNILLTADVPSANMSNITTYLAEGRFFRAWFYYDLLRRFGGVPWTNKPIDPNNFQELETPRSARNAIADSIISDLDYAINYLPEASQEEKFRLNKEVALAFKSRVCLYEGTWEKYHEIEGDPFRVDGSDGSKYLQLAMESALEVINSGLYSIEKKGDEPYFNLFNREDYSSNKEIMFWRKSLREIRQQNVSRIIIEGEYNAIGGLTKNLIESYLCTDGLPISLTSLSVIDDSLTAVIQNRDPRLAQTIFYPGVPRRIEDGTDKILAEYIHPDLTVTVTGYHFRKGASMLMSNFGMQQDQMAYKYFRYAEVLLNYIEAKAELNEMGKATLAQSDFDISINKIRERVDMPYFNLATSFVDPQNPFSGKIPWYLVEIRRERRVELALEGFRFDDIFRWAAADELIKGKIFRGAKYQWYIDMGWNPGITYVDEEGLLSPWYNTYVDMQGGYAFNLNRDYLYPIPFQEIVLAGYQQNPGWE